VKISERRGGMTKICKRRKDRKERHKKRTVCLDPKGRKRERKKHVTGRWEKRLNVTSDSFALRVFSERRALQKRKYKENQKTKLYYRKKKR